MENQKANRELNNNSNYHNYERIRGIMECRVESTVEIDMDTEIIESLKSFGFSILGLS